MKRGLQTSARQFAEAKVISIADELDRNEAEMPMSLIQEIGRLGYFGFAISELCQGGF